MPGAMLSGPACNKDAVNIKATAASTAVIELTCHSLLDKSKQLPSKACIAVTLANHILDVVLDGDYLLTPVWP